VNGCCPVCRAAFRGVRECPRCGADLGSLMSLAVHAWRLRQRAREALAAGDYAAAGELAREAQEIHNTPAGRGLTSLAQWALLDRPYGRMM